MQGARARLRESTPRHSQIGQHGGLAPPGKVHHGKRRCGHGARLRGIIDHGLTPSSESPYLALGLPGPVDPSPMPRFLLLCLLPVLWLRSGTWVGLKPCHVWLTRLALDTLPSILLIRPLLLLLLWRCCRSWASVKPLLWQPVPARDGGLLVARRWPTLPLDVGP